ncbi:MAG: hypothetical protein CMK74_20335 [Pseudomonadales bacterium]|nr:hypothetical protein [Pseudomonadales bacterium]
MPEDKHRTAGQRAGTLFTGGLSGAAPGAVIGATFGGPLGAAIGAGVGGLGGLIVGGAENRRQETALAEADAQQRALEERLGNVGADFDLYLQDVAAAEGQQTRIAQQRAREAASRSGLGDAVGEQLASEASRDVGSKFAAQRAGALRAQAAAMQAERGSIMQEFLVGQQLAAGADTSGQGLAAFGQLAGSAAQLATAFGGAGAAGEGGETFREQTGRIRDNAAARRASRQAARAPSADMGYVQDPTNLQMTPAADTLQGLTPVAQPAPNTAFQSALPAGALSGSQLAGDQAVQPAPVVQPAQPTAVAPAVAQPAPAQPAPAPAASIPSAPVSVQPAAQPAAPAATDVSQRMDQDLGAFRELERTDQGAAIDGMLDELESSAGLADYMGDGRASYLRHGNHMQRDVDGNMVVIVQDEAVRTELEALGLSNTVYALESEIEHDDGTPYLESQQPGGG